MAKKDEVETQEVVDTPETQETPEKKKKVDILRGRMPVALVKMIKFAPEDMSNSTLAAMHRTTVGKVDDIRKGRNFDYVTEDFIPSEKQAKDAADRINLLGNEYVDDLMSQLEEMGIATEEESADFIAKRKAARKTSTRVSTKSEGEVEADVEVDTDELLG